MCEAQITSCWRFEFRLYPIAMLARFHTTARGPFACPSLTSWSFAKFKQVAKLLLMCNRGQLNLIKDSFYKHHFVRYKDFPTFLSPTGTWGHRRTNPEPSSLSFRHPAKNGRGWGGTNGSGAVDKKRSKMPAMVQNMLQRWLDVDNLANLPLLPKPLNYKMLPSAETTQFKTWNQACVGCKRISPASSRTATPCVYPRGGRPWSLRTYPARINPSSGCRSWPTEKQRLQCNLSCLSSNTQHVTWSFSTSSSDVIARGADDDCNRITPRFVRCKRHIVPEPGEDESTHGKFFFNQAQKH